MEKARKRVVVTGMGVLSSIGDNLPAFRESLLAKKCGIQPSEYYRKYFSTAYASEVPGGTEYPDLEPALVEKLDKGALWSYKVGREALVDSGLLGSPELATTGLMIGVSSAGTEAFMPAITGNASDLSAEKIKYSGSYASVSWLTASLLKLGGGFELVATACTASPNAIGLAFDAIQNDKAETMLAIGSEPLYLPTFAGFYALKAMADGPCSPFADAPGMSIGEGAGAVVLEEYEHAKARGATIYCEILGYATNSDAYHETAPDPKAQGAISVMTSALRNTGLKAIDIDYVNVHGTGTEANDRAETVGLRAVFAERPDVPVSSTKSYFGHNIGSAGILELIACLATLPEGKVPPTLNFGEMRSYAAGINVVANEFLDQRVNVFMKNNYAFGGNNCSLIACLKPESVPRSRYRPRRVAITGAGSVSSLGVGKEALFEGLRTGRSGFGKMALPLLKTLESNGTEEPGWLRNTPELIDMFKQLPVNEAGELDFWCYEVPAFNPRHYLRSFDPRRTNRISTFAMVALEQALNDANYKIRKNNREDVGLIMGVSKGPQSAIDKVIKSLYPDPNNVRTSEFPMALMNSIATQCAISKQIKGYNTTLATGFSAALGALTQGYEVIRQGLQPYMVVGGADENSFVMSMLLNSEENAINYSQDADAYQIYSSVPRGCSPSEGSCCLFLEDLDLAQERGSGVYAEIVGYGRTSHAVHFNTGFEPGVAMARSIQQALDEAGIQPAQIDMACGSSWGAAAADINELRGLSLVFGGAGKTIPLTNFNGYFGFAESSSAAQNLLGTLGCMREGVIYPILFTREFTASDHRFVVGETLRKSIEYALVTGLSEGGNHYAIVLRKV